MDNDNFFSINRLVEFGLGMAVAKQMTDSMNLALQNASMPGAQPVPRTPALHHYHVLLDGKPAGPFADHELSRLITEGRLKKDTYVWRPGMPDWRQAENIAEVLRLVALAPPPFPAGG